MEFNTDSPFYVESYKKKLIKSMNELVKLK